MSTRSRWVVGAVAMTAAMGMGMVAEGAAAQTVIDQWATIKAPPPPVLKPVTLDRKTTALLVLDLNRQTCNERRRARCIESLPRIRKLLTAARAAGVMVAYSVGGGGTAADIPADLAPAKDEPVVSSGVDKFRGTKLEEILKAKGIKTVVTVGTSAIGAVIYTASGAAMRGFKVIVPVDGISAHLPYSEQYTVWHLANAPLVSAAVTLTRIDDIKF